MWQPAAAQRQTITLIRDAEIENTIRAYATPLFNAAGLDAEAVNVNIVNDPSLNAFVAGGQRLFIFSGLLMRSRNSGEVIGVIAHETGHIAGGHLARTQEAIENATTEAIIEMLLGIAAVGAAAASGGGMGGGAGAGYGVSGAQRSLFSYSRTQESSADQAGLVFLERTGQSARGLLEFSQMLMQQELVAGIRQDPYLRTHPLTQERVAAMQAHVDRSRFSDVPLNPRFEEMHARMVAKLYGFIDPAQALRKYPPSDTSVAGRYARSIAYYRTGRLQEALATLDTLERQMPNDPYFPELRGQMLFENQRVAEAIPPLERAVALMPQSPLIRIALAQALLEVNQPARDQQALKLLEGLTEAEEQNSHYWRLMSIVYDRTGNIGMRSLALAERAYAMGNRRDAAGFAARAERELRAGSPGWQRAQDIRFLAERQPRR